MRRTRMFAMHDRTRRMLCRLGFLLLCVLPTLSIALWSAVVCSPSYHAARRAAWERRLSQLLGLVVTVADTGAPARGVTLLDGVQLFDPETNATVARIRQLELVQIDGQWIVLAGQPELQAEHLGRCWEAVHENVLRSRGAGQWRARFSAGELTLRRGGDRGASTLTDVRCQFEPGEHGPQAVFEFRDVALQMAEPAQWRVSRNRSLSPPATHWELSTRSTALPCSLLAEHVPTLAWLGERATFQGSVEAVCTARGWEGQWTGRFHNVDLDRVVTDHYDHKLSGNAEVVFTRARFQDGKLVEAAGDLKCEGGVISRSLLAQAGKSLGLTADPRVSAIQADTYCRYQSLRFGFQINAEGLKLVGLCHSVGEGVVMADEFGPLLSDRPQEIAQVVALVRTLASRHGEQVPASPEAYQLLHVLPIPSRAERSPEIATPIPNYSPVRLQ